MDALPVDLQTLVNPPAAVVRQEEIPVLRSEMLRTAACSLGARGGLLARSKAIRAEVERNRPILERYRFQSVMLTGGMLPPVISEAREAVKQDSPKLRRIAGVVYRIEAPERFVTVAPTWRDYVFRGLPDGGTVEAPPPNFLPKGDAEQEFWRKTVTSCWTKGFEQADQIFDINMSRLERDFSGMLRYKQLVVSGMIVPPKMGVERQASSGSATELVVEDEVHSIVGTSAFQKDPAKWK